MEKKYKYIMSETIHEVFRCTTKSCFVNGFLNKQNRQTFCVKRSLLNKLFCSFWWSTCEVDVVFLYLEKVSFTEPHVFCRNEESLQTVQLSRATLQCAGFHVKVLILKTCWCMWRQTWCTRISQKILVKLSDQEVISIKTRVSS